MTKFNDLSDPLSLLKTRRSVIANHMTGLGPSASEVDELLAIATRAPDHGKLAPWRFIIFQGNGRTAFGRELTARQRELNPNLGSDLLAFEARRFERAGTVIGVVSAAVKHEKIPRWEQRLSAGAVCQNLLITASAMGFAVQWLTEWYAYDPQIIKLLGLKGDERIAGFIYISTTDAELSERPRPDVTSLVSHWTGA